MCEDLSFINWMNHETIGTYNNEKHFDHMFMIFAQFFSSE